MSVVGLTRVASVVEAPSHLEFVSSFFINSAKATMERRAAAEVQIEKHRSANPTNRTATPE
jgi:hypothetical protein